jgi:hypothetical protein
VRVEVQVPTKHMDGFFNVSSFLMDASGGVPRPEDL